MTVTPASRVPEALVTQPSTENEPSGFGVSARPEERGGGVEDDVTAVDFVCQRGPLQKPVHDTFQRGVLHLDGSTAQSTQLFVPIEKAVIGVLFDLFEDLGNRHVADPERNPFVGGLLRGRD